MTAIPRPALLLGLAGLIPFLWGAAGLYLPAVASLGEAIFGTDPRFGGAGLVLSYGIVILSFMSGVLWGFATRAGSGAGGLYALSVLPALWAQFVVRGDGAMALALLGAGYLGLLALDAHFAARGLAPAWWMRLRLMLTAGVLASLAATALA